MNFIIQKIQKAFNMSYTCVGKEKLIQIYMVIVSSLVAIVINFPTNVFYFNKNFNWMGLFRWRGGG